MKPPPPDWIDPVVVERALSRLGPRALPAPGRRLTLAEQAEVVRRIRAVGRGSSALVLALRCNGTKARKLMEATA